MLEAYLFIKNHRYLRKEDAQSILDHINSAKVHLIGAWVAGSKLGKQAWSRDVPALAAQIIAAATNITNIQNKTGSMCY